MGLVALQHVGSSQTRARTRVPCIGRQILNHCATREAPPASSLEEEKQQCLHIIYILGLLLAMNTAVKIKGSGFSRGAAALCRTRHGKVHPSAQHKGCYLLLGVAGPDGSPKTKPLCSQQETREALVLLYLLTLRIQGKMKTSFGCFSLLIF